MVSEGKDRARPRATASTISLKKKRRDRRLAFEDSRGKTDCRRVASGTHHALVIARLPIGIGHPRAHAGLVYVRERRPRLGRGRVPVSLERERVPRGGSRAVPLPGNHARPRVGTRKTNACESTTRASRARAGSRGRACVSDRALFRRFSRTSRSCLSCSRVVGALSAELTPTPPPPSRRLVPNRAFLRIELSMPRAFHSLEIARNPLRQ